MVILAHIPPLNLWSYIWVEEKGGGVSSPQTCPTPL